jgi:hypothetical protein
VAPHPLRYAVQGAWLATAALGSHCDGESGVRGLQKDSKRQTKLTFGCDAGKRPEWTALTSGMGHFSVQMGTLDQLR